MRLENIDVAYILKNYDCFEWVHQGVGFLRAYLDVEKEDRLHLWHPGIQIEGISYIHTHNWNFTSVIVAGGLINVHYGIKMNPGGEYVMEAIDTTTGKVIGHPERCNLEVIHKIIAKRGDLYFEDAEVIHTIQLVSKCISVIKRDFVEPKHTYSFRHIHEPWANVQARPATEAELSYYIPQFKEMLNELN